MFSPELDYLFFVWSFISLDMMRVLRECQSSWDAWMHLILVRFYTFAHCIILLYYELLSYWLSRNETVLFKKREKTNCWGKFFSLVNATWSFGDSFSLNIQQVLFSPLLKKGSRLIWANMTKALLAKLWFERNQKKFHDKKSSWFNHFETGK